MSTWTISEYRKHKVNSTLHTPHNLQWWEISNPTVPTVVKILTLSESLSTMPAWRNVEAISQILNRTVDNNCYVCEHWIWSVQWPQYLQSSSEYQHLAVWSQDQHWSIGWMAAEGQDLICGQPPQWHKQDCLCYIQTNTNCIWLVGVSQKIVCRPGRTNNNLDKVCRCDAWVLFSSSPWGSVQPVETTAPLPWLVYTRLKNKFHDLMDYLDNWEI